MATNAARAMTADSTGFSREARAPPVVLAEETPDCLLPAAALLPTPLVAVPVVLVPVLVLLPDATVPVAAEVGPAESADEYVSPLLSVLLLPATNCAKVGKVWLVSMYG